MPAAPIKKPTLTAVNLPTGELQLTITPRVFQAGDLPDPRKYRISSGRKLADGTIDWLPSFMKIEAADFGKPILLGRSEIPIALADTDNFALMISEESEKHTHVIDSEPVMVTLARPPKPALLVPPAPQNQPVPTPGTRPIPPAPPIPPEKSMWQKLREYFDRSNRLVMRLHSAWEALKKHWRPVTIGLAVIGIITTLFFTEWGSEKKHGFLVWWNKPKAEKAEVADKTPPAGSKTPTNSSPLVAQGQEGPVGTLITNGAGITTGNISGNGIIVNNGTLTIASGAFQISGDGSNVIHHVKEKAVEKTSSTTQSGVTNGMIVIPFPKGIESTNEFSIVNPFLLRHAYLTADQSVFETEMITLPAYGKMLVPVPEKGWRVCVYWKRDGLTKGSMAMSQNGLVSWNDYYEGQPVDNVLAHWVESLSDKPATYVIRCFRI